MPQGWSEKSPGGRQIDQDGVFVGRRIPLCLSHSRQRGSRGYRGSAITLTDRWNRWSMGRNEGAGEADVYGTGEQEKSITR